ncbi:hypothetical protein S101174_01663 [Levilactobacillus brevis]|nr:hypothetical protein S101174_01663 [Levilactobacillus brevis]
MTLWHKKGALTWPSELEDKLHLSYSYSLNSTPDGRWLQWH